MKVGSLVERVPNPFSKTRSEIVKKLYKGPEIGEICTVREVIEMCGEVGLLLEEYVNPPLNTIIGLREVAWRVQNFREIQPPMSLEFIEEMQHPLTLLTQTV